MRTTKKTASTSALAKRDASKRKTTRAAKKPRSSKKLREDVERLEARADSARRLYQRALGNMLEWNGYQCRILAPTAAVLLEDGSELSVADVGLVEPRTGMLIMCVSGDWVELAFNAEWL